MRNIAVLGGGILGSEIAKQANILGDDVRLASRSFLNEELSNEGIRLISGDASDPEFLENFLKDCDDLVIVFGGMRPYQAELDPDLNLGLIENSLTNILTAVAQNELSSVSYISSGGAVYGEAHNQHHFDESDPPQPSTAYGRGKLAAEKILLDFGFSGSPKARVFRVSNIFGRGEIRDENFGFIEHALAAVRNRSELHVFGDGEDCRDFIPVSVAAQQVVSVIHKDDGPLVLNVANGVSNSLNQVIEMIEQITGQKIKIQQRERRACDLVHSRLNVDLLQKLTGYVPPDLRNELTGIWDAYN